MPIAEPETDLDEFTYQAKEEEENYDFDVEITGDDIGLNCIRPTPSTHLSVIRCALSQSKEKSDRRRTAMLHTFTKIGGRNCKVTVDSGS